METKLFWQSSMPKHWHMIKLKYVLKKLQRSKMPNAELLICSNSGRVTKRGDNKLGLVADDDKIYQECMDTVVEYLDKYMPVEK